MSSLHVGRSSITPTDLAARHHARLDLAVDERRLQQHRRVRRHQRLGPREPHRLAHRQTLFDHVAERMPVILLEAPRVAGARGSAHTLPRATLELVDQLGVQHAVRHAVDLRRHDRLGDGLAE